jgi:hypothetical protein
MKSVDLYNLTRSSRLKITIVNKEQKYNPRTDRENHKWFRLENKFILGPAFDALSGGQKFLLIYLIAVAQELNTDTVETSLPNLLKASGLRTAKVIEAIEFFMHKKTISVEELPTRKRELCGTYAGVMQKKCGTYANQVEQNQSLTPGSDTKVTPLQNSNSLNTKVLRGEPAVPALPPPNLSLNLVDENQASKALMNVESPSPTTPIDVASLTQNVTHSTTTEHPEKLEPEKKQGSPTSRFIALYKSLWRSRYGTYPDIAGKDLGVPKRILDALNEDRAMHILRAYFEMPDVASKGWFKEQRHNLLTLENNVTKIGVWCDEQQRIKKSIVTKNDPEADKQLDRIGYHTKRLKDAMKRHGFKLPAKARREFEPEELHVIDKVGWSNLVGLPAHEFVSRVKLEIELITMPSEAPVQTEAYQHLMAILSKLVPTKPLPTTTV